jgi:hypothetical protein
MVFQTKMTHFQKTKIAQFKTTTTAMGAGRDAAMAGLANLVVRVRV